MTCNPLPDTLRSVYDPSRLMRSCCKRGDLTFRNDFVEVYACINEPVLIRLTIKHEPDTADGYLLYCLAFLA